MSGAEKVEACEKLNKMADEIGPEGVSQLMACDGKYPDDFKEAISFCQSCDLPDNENQDCLPSAPHVFEDGYDGSHMMVALSGDKLTITSTIGSAERYFMILELFK